MKKWLRSGLLWGGLLYLITMILFPILSGENLSFAKIILGIFLWIVVGLAIGFLFFNKPVTAAKKKKKR